MDPMCVDRRSMLYVTRGHALSSSRPFKCLQGASGLPYRLKRSAVSYENAPPLSFATGISPLVAPHDHHLAVPLTSPYWVHDRCAHVYNLDLNLDSWMSPMARLPRFDAGVKYL